MSHRLRVHGMTMSLDGFVAGPGQTLENPLGAGGTRLHEWIFETKTGCEMIGLVGGQTGVDDDFVAQGFDGIGATIMGRNMFGPERGQWSEDPWNGWWGANPPFHHPVFVLTHHPRPPLEMQGGTTFHFVDDAIESTLTRAFAAADGADVRLGGGAATVRQFLEAGLVDELHVAVVPILLGGGERLFERLGDVAADYACTEFVGSSAVTHVRMRRTV